MADAEGRRELMRFNLVMGATIGIVILFFILASVWGSGAIQKSSEKEYSWWEVPLQERHKWSLISLDCEVNCPSMVLTIGRGRRNFSLRSIYLQVNKTWATLGRL